MFEDGYLRANLPGSADYASRSPPVSSPESGEAANLQRQFVRSTMSGSTFVARRAGT